MELIGLSELDVELLLLLAWAGPFLSVHLGQVFASHWCFRQLQRRVAVLQDAGLIAGVHFYRKPKGTRGPERVGKFWMITEAGEMAIAQHDRAPFKRATAIRTALLNHDSSVAGVVAHLIAQTRPLLSGLAVFRETRVDDKKPAPIADTIVVLRTRGEHHNARELPWSRLGVQPDEAFRVIAIESDRGSEELSVIAEKARTYKLLPNDEDYLARYAGVMPLPLWIAPSARRLASIQRVWVQHWPNGSWLRTTDADRGRDHFTHYHAGQERTRDWLDDWAFVLTQPVSNMEKAAF